MPALFSNKFKMKKLIIAILVLFTLAVLSICYIQNFAFAFDLSEWEELEENQIFELDSQEMFFGKVYLKPEFLDGDLLKVSIMVEEMKVLDMMEVTEEVH